MYKFLAIRIHDGFLTWDEVKTKKFYQKVRDAYTALYGTEDTADEPEGNL